MKEIVTIHGQSIDDVAAQHYGSTDGVLQVLLDNPGLIDQSDDIVPGTVLMIDESKVVDKKVVEYYAQDGVLPPATNYLNINNWCFAFGYLEASGLIVATEYLYAN